MMNQYLNAVAAKQYATAALIADALADTAGPQWYKEGDRCREMLAAQQEEIKTMTHQNLEILFVRPVKNDSFLVKFLQSENDPAHWFLGYYTLSHEEIFLMPFVLEEGDGGGWWDFSPMEEYVRKNIDPEFAY
jgi:hypothetical protein